ncbi:hypothetical protein MalM25_12900 [Planctomycetes bacterium MalM25]|nr:hypothetical protein MalM25_12900 [Planctomycetes bacterium MalM25]
MSPNEIELVQASWRHASPIADTVVRLFYRRLFERAPEVRERFHTSMSEQGDHLIGAVEELLSRLDQGDAVSGMVLSEQSFADRGEEVADAWLWALEQEIGRCASEGARNAWRRAIQSDAGVAFKLVALGEVELVGA